VPEASSVRLAKVRQTGAGSRRVGIINDEWVVYPPRISGRFNPTLERNFAGKRQ
jgi:hypothetical protein